MRAHYIISAALDLGAQHFCGSALPAGFCALMNGVASEEALLWVVTVIILHSNFPSVRFNHGNTIKNLLCIYVSSCVLFYFKRTLKCDAKYQANCCGTCLDCM